MYQSIRTYVQTCEVCQKRNRPHMQGPLHLIPVSASFYWIGLDFVGPLSRTPQLNQYIIVATNYMTRWLVACAIEKADAQTVAEFLYNDIICCHGCPDLILSDCGTYFRNDMIWLLLEKLKIKQNFLTPYHPWTNGLVECFNKMLCKSLEKLVQNVVDWNLIIPSILFVYLTACNATTKMILFFLVYEQEARQLIYPSQTEEILEGTILQRIFELLHEAPVIRNKAVENVCRVQIKDKTYYDQKYHLSSGFDIREKVLLEDARKRYSHSYKLHPKCQGPFNIHDKMPIICRLLKGRWSLLYST